jgi:hypothetical protein
MDESMIYTKGLTRLWTDGHLVLTLLFPLIIRNINLARDTPESMTKTTPMTIPINSDRLIVNLFRQGFRTEK